MRHFQQQVGVYIGYEPNSFLGRDTLPETITNRTEKTGRASKGNKLVFQPSIFRSGRVSFFCLRLVFGQGRPSKPLSKEAVKSRMANDNISYVAQRQLEDAWDCKWER